MNGGRKSQCIYILNLNIHKKFGFKEERKYIYKIYYDRYIKYFDQLIN